MVRVGLAGSSETFFRPKGAGDLSPGVNPTAMELRNAGGGRAGKQGARRADGRPGASQVEAATLEAPVESERLKLLYGAVTVSVFNPAVASVVAID